MISFAVTAYNEMTEPQEYGQLLLKCIAAAQAHPAIDDITIVNDGPAGYAELAELLWDAPKVRLFRNEERMGVFTNKVEAVARARNDWVITCDSDNIMDAAYLDYMVEHATDQMTWYCASFAKPQFDYRKLVGRWDIDTIKSFFETLIAACAINTGNQTVYRPEFMRVFERFRGVRRFDLMLPNYMGLSEEARHSTDWYLSYGACDSILINIEWFLNGGTLEICEDLEYEHVVHTDKSGSNYDRAPDAKEKLAETLRQHLAEGTLT